MANNEWRDDSALRRLHANDGPTGWDFAVASLLDLGAAETARAIVEGRLSAAETVRSHIQCIERVNPKLNAVVWKRFEQAEAEATQVDAQRREGAKLPPLAGVPITLKECLDLEGTPSTFGLPSRAKTMATSDERHVRALREAGAIVLGKTNVAQMLLFVETDNPLYGRTNNPWDVTRTTGGSSGGEGAIIAARGSCLGLGTDIGGSVRIPAHFCGIVSIKPTAGRCPDAGRYSYPIGQQVIESQVGVMANSTGDIALGLDVINRANLNDNGVYAPLGDPASVDLSKLTVGYYADDGVTSVCPTGQRAVREAADVLRAAGASVFEWKPTTVATAQELYFAAMTAGGSAFKDILGRNKADPRIAALLGTASMSNRRARWLATLLGLTGQAETARVLRAFGNRDTAAYWDVARQVVDFRNSFAKAMNDANRMDLILAPGFAVPAAPHGASTDPAFLGTHTILYNVLGYPAGIVPWTRVRPNEERGPEVQHLTPAQRRNVNGGAGLPFGVQVIARPWREHVALAAMEMLEATARKRSDYPSKPSL